MAEIHWLKPVGDSFSDALDWSGGRVPGPADDAILDAGGMGSAPYAVIVSTRETVVSIQTAANATLDVDAGMFTAAAGSGAGINAGTLAVADGAVFSATGTMTNTGVLEFLGTSKGADLRIGAAGLTLAGGGQVMLADSLSAPFQPCPPKYSLDRVYGVSGATLTNLDNTIVGAGHIGFGVLGLVNEAKGVIDASLVTDLLLDPAGVLINRGLLESTGAGGLYIFRSTVDNTSGGVIAANGGIVYLSSSHIIGGTLTSSGKGYFFLDHGPTILDGASAGSLTNNGYLRVSDGATLTIDGAIDNIGKIEVATGPFSTSVIVGAAGATLSGGGKVELAGDPATQIIGATAGATLTNVDNTIYGQGLIGAGSLILINEAGGVILGDFSNDRLILDTGANTITNFGLIGAKARGTVIVQSAIDNSGLLAVAGGTLTVNGAVTGSGAAVIAGGTLNFASSFNQKVVFRGAGGVLELAQSQAYAGQVVGFSTTGGTALDLRDIGFVSSTEATFSGAASGGVLTATDGTHTAHITLAGDYLASTFTAASDGQGGTIVVDAAAPAAAAHQFVAAAAALGAKGGGLVSMAHESWRAPPAMLARPGVVAA